MAPSNDEPNWSRTTIHRVPTWFKQTQQQHDTNQFEPQVVSLGPYHCGIERLKAMESHKRRGLDRFLGRSTKSSIEELMLVLLPHKEKLIECYEDLGENDLMFLTTMVLDGCFIYEYLRAEVGVGVGSDYEDCDPVFGGSAMKFMSGLVGRDMLLVENQVPLLVLCLLVSTIVHDPDMPMRQTPEAHITNLITMFYKIEFDYPTIANITSNITSGLHILDVYRRSKLLKGNYSNGTVLSASLLYTRGIRFKRSQSNSFLDINYTNTPNQALVWNLLCILTFGIPYLLRRPVLSLPNVSINPDMEVTLLNLLAFEMLHKKVGFHVTSYVFFMASLVRQEDDVGMLCWQDERFKFDDEANEGVVVDFFANIAQKVPTQLARNVVGTNEEVMRRAKQKRWNVYFFFKRDTRVFLQFWSVFFAGLNLTYGVMKTYYDQKSNPEVYKLVYFPLVTLVLLLVLVVCF